MLISLETCITQKQHYESHCDISTNTMFAKSKHVPKRVTNSRTIKPHEILLREKKVKQNNQLHMKKIVFRMQYPQF